MIYAFVAFSSFVSAMTNATNELRAFKSLGNDLDMKYMIFMDIKSAANCAQAQKWFEGTNYRIFARCCDKGEYQTFI